MTDNKSAKRYPFPVFPEGWFCVALSRELPPGKVLSKHHFGHDLVLYRTRSGQARLIAAYCPHMGAHFGYGGTVEGELIRCPFHSFCFDGEGACVSTPYAGKIPPKAKVRTWPLREIHGLLLTYYHPQSAAPRWEIPELVTDGWTDFFMDTWNVRTHPQETTENSVDMGHLTEVHGYTDLETLSELTTDGPYLTVSYAMRRPAGILGGVGRNIRSEFQIHVHGLGYSLVEVYVPSLDMHIRHFVMATPIDGERIVLRGGSTLKVLPKPAKLSPALAVVPRKLATRLVGHVLRRAFAHDVSQDFDIWEHKQYIEPPALARGDGPVGRYRKWAKQFYRFEESDSRAAMAS